LPDNDLHNLKHAVKKVDKYDHIKITFVPTEKKLTIFKGKHIAM